jgi:phosphoglycolate phosphatase
MKYKLVIFDFDGTLADSLPWIMGVINEIADKYKFKRIDKSEIETLRSYDANKLLKLHRVPFWKIPMIANHARALMTKDIHHISLFEGIDGLLLRLSGNGVTLAIVTTNSCENVRKILGPENAALIDNYECGVSIFGKSAKLKRILKKNGVLNSETIYIGDEIRDYEASRNVNIPFGAVSWGYARIETLKPYLPREIFTSIEEIVENILET